MHKLDSDSKTRESFYEQLHDEIALAAKVVYELDRPTSLDEYSFRGSTLLLKREDLSRVHSYKWRGAYFKMSQVANSGFSGQFVAASAGNHAQGVAAAAKQLQVECVIFMPLTTPVLKQEAVKSLGGKFARIELVGDCYDDAADAAEDFLATTESIMIRPFDDLSTIAGQATVGLEMLKQRPELSKIYVPIGGGGLASGVAFAVKKILKSNCQIIGVEVENQNSMQLSSKCGHRITIENVDTFCDGTAVRQPGRYTFEICRELLDDMITVSNFDVSAAIKSAWDVARIVPEPSGGIALAGALNQLEQDCNEKVSVVISGSNMDFKTLPRVVRMSAPAQQRRYFRFQIAETNGSLIQLLDQFMGKLNIVDFQYGKTDKKIANPVLGIEGPSVQLDDLVNAANSIKIHSDEISGESLSEFRVIPFRPDLCEKPFFLKVDFPNRPGALRDLMRQISDSTNICYFNFTDSGEMEGHALIGFELLCEDSEHQIRKSMFELGIKFQTADRQ